MVADGTGKIDKLLIQNIDLSALTEEERLELQKQITMQNAQYIQAGIEASMTGNKAKLEELRKKFEAGREASGHYFKQWDIASYKELKQSTTVWQAQKRYQNINEKHNLWAKACDGINLFRKGISSDASSFSNATFGGSLNNIGDTFELSNRQSYITNQASLYAKSMNNSQKHLTEEQEILANNEKETQFYDSALTEQLWTNRMTVDEMQYYTELLARYNLYKNS